LSAGHGKKVWSLRSVFASAGYRKEKKKTPRCASKPYLKKKGSLHQELLFEKRREGLGERSPDVKLEESSGEFFLFSSIAREEKMPKGGPQGRKKLLLLSQSGEGE